jgi:hypothetical protein
MSCLALPAMPLTLVLIKIAQMDGVERLDYADEETFSFLTPTAYAGCKGHSSH